MVLDRQQLIFNTISVADFNFIKNPKNKRWLIMSPRRAHRPSSGEARVCPFCPGAEEEYEVFRIGGIKGDTNWDVMVVPNKYPFSRNHEVIIDSHSHIESIETFPLEQVVKLITVYRERFMEHHHKGQVCIFHNRGKKAGESISHSHTQLVVIPEKVNLQAPLLRDIVSESVLELEENYVVTEHFRVFCPEFSEWPDEVWVMPKRRGEIFGGIKDVEITDMANILQTIIRLLSLRHQEALAYNFSIFHGEDWYLRIVPREKVLGGFEVATNVSVNTQDPGETFAFLKEHFFEADIEKIFREHKAEYERRV